MLSLLSSFLPVRLSNSSPPPCCCLSPNCNFAFMFFALFCVVLWFYDHVFSLRLALAHLVPVTVRAQLFTTYSYGFIVKENIYISIFKSLPQDVIENESQAIKLYFIYIIAEGSQLGYIVPVLLHYKCIKNFCEVPENMARLLIIDICILSGNYEFAIQKTCIILHLPYARPGQTRPTRAHYSTLWVMGKVSHKDLGTLAALASSRLADAPKLHTSVYRVWL